MNIAIITARGGSKRIPRKNIKHFCGKPIIAYSIEAAIHSGVFDEVMVSTDDNEIAEISKSYGAKVPFMRSEKTSDDFATTADVIKEVLTNYKSIGTEFDNFCCIYPTAPFVTPEKLKNAYEMLLKEDAYSVMTVVQYSYPPQRSLSIENGHIVMNYPEYNRARSQDLSPIYHDCGQFYFVKSNDFLNGGEMIGENTIPLIIEELEVQDIDTIQDWIIAENKFRLMTDKD